MTTMTTPTRITWGALAFLSLAIALVSSRYFTMNPDVYFPEQQAVYIRNTTLLLVHIVGGVTALMLGPVQFLPRFRARRPGVHRVVGRAYLTGILLGGASGLFLAWLAFGGIISHLGFFALSVLWLATGAMALWEIRAGRVATHRRWMVRNVGLTLAAVTLRLWLPMLTSFGVEFADAYRTVAWLAWVPNLALAEWWLRRRGPVRVGSDGGAGRSLTLGA